MPKLLIVGAGQYGRLVRELAQLDGYEEIAFLDDAAPDAAGTLTELERFANRGFHAIVALGNPAMRQALSRRLEELHFEMPTLIHPRAWVSPSATLAPGCVVEANAVVSTGAVVGSASFVCAGAVVNHNAVVSACCQLDCGVVVPANAAVPPGTKVLANIVFRSDV